MPECSRGGGGGEEHARQAKERGRGGGRRTKKGQKKAGDKRGQFRSQQKLLRSLSEQSKPAPDHKKQCALRPRDDDDRRTDHLFLELSQKQKNPLFPKEE